MDYLLTQVNLLIDSYLLGLSANPLARITGVFSSLVGAYAYLCKSEKNTKLMFGISSFILCFHMYFIGSLLGSGLSLIAFVRLIWSARIDTATDKSKGLGLFVGFSILYSILLYLTYKNPQDVYGYIATQFSSWATFMTTGIQFRLYLLLSGFFWILFDFSIGAWEMGISSCISFAIACYALYREIIKKD